MMKEELDGNLPRLLAYLSSIAPLYPFGIPRRCLRERAGCGAPRWGHGQCDLLFVLTGAARPEEEQLLRAAIERGMKLPLQAAELLETAPSREFDPRLWASVLAVRPRIVVALGEESVAALLPGGRETTVSRGGWYTHGELPILATHPLQAVLSDRERKREFWEDLRAVMARLAGQSGERHNVEN